MDFYLLSTLTSTLYSMFKYHHDRKTATRTSNSHPFYITLELGTHSHPERPVTVVRRLKRLSFPRIVGLNRAQT